MSTQNAFKGYRKWWLIAAIACVIGLIGLITVSILYSQNEEAPIINYGIIFDAGSSHTSLTIYKWDSEKTSGTGKVTELKSCRANGTGLANYVKTADEIGPILHSCLEDAELLIPKDQDKTSRMFFGATAGMRILQLTDPDGANRIMTKVTEILSALHFEFHPDHARILTGEEEAVFGWITINYLSSVLGSTERKDTLGALDMGGASTQISYYTTSINSSGEDLRLYGNDYHVFSRSFLCFGLDEFERRFYARLASEPEDAQGNITNPCNPKGNLYVVSHDELFNQMCTPDDTKPDKKFTFAGDYNQLKCDRMLADLLDQKKCSENYEYCLDTRDFPRTNDSFLAFSGFYNIMNNLQVTNSSLQEVKTALETYCKKEYIPQEPNEPNYILQTCFRSNYVLKLLSDVYAFDGTWDKLSFVKKINKADVGWALGFMTNATNAIPKEEPHVVVNSTAFIVLLILFIVFIVMGFAFAFLGWKQKN